MRCTVPKCVWGSDFRFFWPFRSFSMYSNQENVFKVSGFTFYCNFECGNLARVELVRSTVDRSCGNVVSNVADYPGLGTSYQVSGSPGSPYGSPSGGRCTQASCMVGLSIRPLGSRLTKHLLSCFFLNQVIIQVNLPCSKCILYEY